MKSTDAFAWSRRDFLKSTAALGAGLIIGVHLPRFARAQAGAAALARPASAGPFVPNAFVRIAPDDTVTVLVKHIEFGQGPFTGLATLVAEELDADWSQMRAEHAPTDAEIYKNFAFGAQGTGGSTAIANSYEQMRTAGATARALLVAAAAEEWGVPADEITVKQGVIAHAGSGRSARFGALADKAVRLRAPQNVKLKDPKDFKLIGTNVPKLDSAIKSNGAAQFTMDLSKPGMLTVLVAHPPRFGGRVASFDDSQARKVKGVLDVKAIPEGVAVYARSFWAAKQGRDALKIEWNLADTESRSSAQLIAEYRALASARGRLVTNRGDVDGTLEQAAKTLEVEYEFPYLAHAPMEPLDCVIELREDGAEVWLGSQLQTGDHMTVANVLGLPPEKVVINTMLAGGSFGRRAQPDSGFAKEAAECVKAYGRGTPIKLVWTREDDIQGGRYRPIYVHRLKGGVNDRGEIVAWENIIVGQSIFAGSPFASMITEGVDPSSVEGARDLPYAIPNLSVSLHTTKVGVPVLWWRSVGHTHTGFATETFIDELLQAAGKDPVAGRLALLRDHPRHAGVLQAVAERAGWGSTVPQGRARGVAVHKSFDSYVAQIAEVSRDRGGYPCVHKVWCAVDCGVPVNPNVIAAQMEGGIGFGLGAALFDEITLREGRIAQSNFHDYRMIRINEMPEVDVTVIRSSEAPTGVGEPGVPPIAPAVANAWAALTGERVRRLPFLRPATA
jgi:isoquinoline 1-oxidoreductase subunit beta